MRQLDLGDSRHLWLLITMLLLMMVAGIVDLILDAPLDLLSLHVLAEIAFAGLCFAMATLLWASALQSQRSLARTRAALAFHETQVAVWRGRAQRLLRGLGIEIDRQMSDWGLSPAEAEVALLLLKGYSTKEISVHLNKSERTVRQQCSAAYRRSGLAGRAELSAFFLEDLLLPMEPSREERPGETADSRWMKIRMDTRVDTRMETEMESRVREAAS